MQAMTAGMKSLKEAASSGGFKVSKEGAQAYINAIAAAADELDTMEADVVELGQQTRLGTSPDGQEMTRYNAESVNGGAGTLGIFPAIQALRAALDDAKAAMESVLATYTAVDEGSASSFKS